MKKVIQDVLKKPEYNDKVIDGIFYTYCTQCGANKKTPRKEPLPYWIIEDLSLDDLVRTDEAREREAAKLTDEELLQRARNASQNEPQRRSITGSHYARNEYVAAYIKRALKGSCDLC